MPLPWFVIRADAAVNIGSGHVMRCLALAKWAIQYGVHCVLLTREPQPALSNKLIDLGVTSLCLTVTAELQTAVSTIYPTIYPYRHSHWLDISEATDAKLSSQAIQQQTDKFGTAPLFIMLDHYALAAPWEKLMASHAPVLCVDDLSDRPHQCQWLVDQTYGKTSDDYRDLTPASCITWIGAEYSLLRPEFKQIRAHFQRLAPSVDEKLRLLITLGGVDEHNVTMQVLGLLAHTQLAQATQLLAKLSITLVLGAANPHRAVLAQYCQQLNADIKLIVNSNDMATLMAQHDVCIGAAGSTVWERCALGMPTLMLVLAENQKTIAQNIAAAGAAINLGSIEQLTAEALADELCRLHSDKQHYLSMAENAIAVCDGMGCERVLMAIFEHIKFRTRTEESHA
jgi:UDP-2,4-diacetamido-2,4,6-trideoxy-beta-L-altropyranose hydrolase